MPWTGQLIIHFCMVICQVLVAQVLTRLLRWNGMKLKTIRRRRVWRKTSCPQPLISDLFSGIRYGSDVNCLVLVLVHYVSYKFISVYRYRELDGMTQGLNWQAIHSTYIECSKTTVAMYGLGSEDGSKHDGDGEGVGKEWGQNQNQRSSSPTFPMRCRYPQSTHQFKPSRSRPVG